MFQDLIKSLGTLLIIAVNNLVIAEGTVNDLVPIVEIPKINLSQEFYPDNKSKNNVDKNIQVIENSKMPDVKKGNLILAAHSGNSNVGYFKHLDRIKINDQVYIIYKGNRYKYLITNIYDVEKTGYVKIRRDESKNTLTLITCKKNTNQQTVFIGYLSKVLKTP